MAEYMKYEYGTLNLIGGVNEPGPWFGLWRVPFPDPVLQHYAFAWTYYSRSGKSGFGVMIGPWAMGITFPGHDEWKEEDVALLCSIYDDEEIVIYRKTHGEMHRKQKRRR